MQNDEILLALGRLEGKMDSLMKNSHLQTELMREHDLRLRRLETSKATMLGMSSALAFIVSSAVTYLL